MSDIMRWFWLVLISGLVRRSRSDVGTILGYQQVDVDSLHPLTLSWNQVHYLVRENLLEIDNLRYIQDEFYKDLHECFGLEKCLREANLMDGPPQSGGQLGAGALLNSLREERMTLRARHSQLESRFNEITRMAADLATSSAGSRGRTKSSSSFSSSSSSSYSYSSSSSSGSFGGALDVTDFDYHDEGPTRGRG